MKVTLKTMPTAGNVHAQIMMILIAKALETILLIHHRLKIDLMQASR